MYINIFLHLISELLFALLSIPVIYLPLHHTGSESWYAFRMILGVIGFYSRVGENSASFFLID